MAKGSRAFDYYVFNDDLERAVGEMMNIVRNERAGGI
jgi:guanylate kinase